LSQRRGFGPRLGRGIGLRWSGCRRRRRQDLGDDFLDGGFADGARRIPDAALRKREITAARAGVRVEAMKYYLLLLGCEFRQIHARKLGGAIGVCEKNFALVFERFDLGHDGHAEQGANLGFVNGGVPEANMFLYNAAFGVQNERGGQGGDAAVLGANVVGSHGDGIVDAHFLDVLLNIGFFVVDIEADDLEAVFVAVLQSDEVGDFRAAGSAPGGPEIQEDNFALQRGESERLAVERGELELRCGIGVAHEADHGLVVLLRRGESRHKENKQ
jgi:hypothetical protein